MLGNQTWMAENLAYMPEGEQDTDISWTEPRFYVWNDYLLDSDDETQRQMAQVSMDTYGVFYNWWAAMDGDSAPAAGKTAQGICPDGWHIPSEAEWNTLIDFLSEAGSSADEDDPLAIAKALAIDKADTWALADELGVLDLVRNETLTCYNGVPGDGCGHCPACRLRREGLEKYLATKKNQLD